MLNGLGSGTWAMCVEVSTLRFSSFIRRFLQLRMTRLGTTTIATYKPHDHASVRHNHGFFAAREYLNDVASDEKLGHVRENLTVVVRRILREAGQYIVQDLSRR